MPASAAKKSVDAHADGAAPTARRFAVRIGGGIDGRARCSIVSKPSTEADAAVATLEAGSQCGLPFVSHVLRPVSWSALPPGNVAPPSPSTANAIRCRGGVFISDAAVQASIPYCTIGARGDWTSGGATTWPPSGEAPPSPAPMTPGGTMDDILSYRARILLNPETGQVQLRVFKGDRPWDAPAAKVAPLTGPPPKAHSPEAAPQPRAPPSLQG